MNIRLSNHLLVQLLFVALSGILSVRAQTATEIQNVKELIAGRHYDNALSVLEHLTDQYSESSELFRLKGVVLHIKGKLEDAIDAFDEVIDIEDCDTCWAMEDSIGLLSLELSNLRDAEKYFRKADRKGSPDAAYHLMLVELYKGNEELKKSRYNDALSLYKKALEIKEDTLAENYILLALWMKNDTAAVRILADSLRKKLPAYHGAKYYRASLISEAASKNMDEQNYAQAIELYKQANEIDTDTTALSMRLASCYERMNDTGRAMYYYMSALSDSKSFAAASRGLARMYSKERQIEKAIECLQQALNIDANSIRIWSELAELYKKAGKTDEYSECVKIKTKLNDPSLKEDSAQWKHNYELIDRVVLPWLTGNPFALDESNESVVRIQPIPTKQIPPEYPEQAKNSRVQGMVWVKCLIRKNGDVEEVEIMKSDSDMLNDVALSAAKQWKFQPAVMDGRPVAVWGAIPFRFSLR
ncbi:MAG: TonB family protein [Bacteroidetes bacterium]|nr:MAG: TonB family protein [Bacteroidota bacterium]